jgi:predicted metal-dependent phosphoesterase TrpH
MYDLHIHTNRSDGEDSWRAVLEKAEQMKLGGISVTDHDNCRVYAEMQAPERYFSGRIIPGIEMEALQSGISLEILGYGIDTAKMDGLVKGLYLSKEERNLFILRKLYENSLAVGMVFAPDVLGRYDRERYYYASVYLHGEMRRFPQNRRFVEDDTSWAHENIFFRRYTGNPESPLFVNQGEITPPAEKVIAAIHECGGRAFVPHIFQYDDNSAMLLEALLKLPIDGIECFYPDFSAAQTEYLLGTCKKHGLKVSGGSDYHGAHRPNNRLGETGVLPELFF